MKFSELGIVRIGIVFMTIWFAIWGVVLADTTMSHIPTLIGYAFIAFAPMPIFWFLSGEIFSRYKPE